jgi:hypothetical protein
MESGGMSIILFPRRQITMSLLGSFSDSMWQIVGR